MQFFVELANTIWHNLANGSFQEWGNWSYFALTFLIIVEGPVSTLLGAAAASAGFMRLWLVMLCALVGSAVADVGWYYLGYTHSEERVLRYGHWLGLRRRHLDRLQQGMHEHALKILLIAKFTAGFVIPTLMAAGLARVPFRRWFPIVFMGEIFWALVLTMVGFHATAAISDVENGLRYLAVVGGALLFILLFFVFRRLDPARRIHDDVEASDVADAPAQPGARPVSPPGAMQRRDSELRRHINGSGPVREPESMAD